MCTLAIVRFPEHIIFTSNRDDKPERASFEFTEMQIKGKTIYYPEDGLKKGSWFAFDSRGNAAILLNGALTKHTKQSHHTQSRGSIVLDILSSEKNMAASFEQLPLEHTEPFTLVLLENKILYQAQWDGKSKDFRPLSEEDQWFIWSSATLYDEHARAKRAQRFDNFMRTCLAEPETLFNVLSTYDEDKENGFRIKRDNLIQTLSTSQLVVSKNEASFILQHHSAPDETGIKSIKFAI